MKTLVSLPLLVIIMYSCTSNIPEPDVKEFNLKGNVKSFEWRKNSFNNPSAWEELDKFKKWEYNENGYLIHYIEFFQDGRVQNLYYNKNNRLKKKVYTRNNNSKDPFVSKYYYNLRGLLRKEHFYNLNDAREFTIDKYKYDSKGNLIRGIEIDIDDTFVEEHIYEYGNRGLISKEKLLYDGEIFNNYSYTYYLDESIKSKISYGKSISKQDYTVTRYTESELEIERITYRDNEKFHQDYIEYDEYDNPIRHLKLYKDGHH